MIKTNGVWDGFVWITGIGDEMAVVASLEDVVVVMAFVCCGGCVDFW